MAQQDLKQVPGREHYSVEYFRRGRIFSQAHQIASVISFKPRSVLEIGPGGGMVTASLRAVGVEVTTVDVQPELEPDVVASADSLPFEDNHFDVALCCQVMEHLLFEQIGSALREIRRVTRQGLVMSLPDVTRHWFLSVKLPVIGRRTLNWSMPRIPAPAMPSQRSAKSGHQWEIGLRDYPLKRIRTVMRDSGWRLARTWRVPERSWHRFFDLRPA